MWKGDNPSNLDIRWRMNDEINVMFQWLLLHGHTKDATFYKMQYVERLSQK
jgi:hypothetical protein